MLVPSSKLNKNNSNVDSISTETTEDKIEKRKRRHTSPLLRKWITSGNYVIPQYLANTFFGFSRRKLNHEANLIRNWSHRSGMTTVMKLPSVSCFPWIPHWFSPRGERQWEKREGWRNVNRIIRFTDLTRRMTRKWLTRRLGGKVLRVSAVIYFTMIKKVKNL